MNHFAGKKGKGTETTAHVDTLSVEDKLKFAIINGEKAVAKARTKRLWKKYWRRRSPSIPRST